MLRKLALLVSLGLALASTALGNADGAAVFNANCVTCHGDKMDGNGPAGQYMTPKPRDFIKDKFKAGDDKDSIFNTVTNGLSGTAMAGFGAALSDDERHAVVDYVCAKRPDHCPPKKGKRKK